MGGYELHDHLSEQLFRPVGAYFAYFSSSVGNISEQIYSRQALYFSYTLMARALNNPGAMLPGMTMGVIGYALGSYLGISLGLYLRGL